MSFAEDYVNGLRDGLVETGEWQEMDKRAQNKRLKEGAARAHEIAGKLNAIYQASRWNGEHLNLDGARRHLVDRVLAEYRMRTVLAEQAMIDQLRSIVKIN